MFKTLLNCLCSVAVIIVVGCEHMVENRVVQRFAESIQDHDLKLLKSETSEEFETKVAAGDDTFRAFKLLDLPEGKPEVISVKNERAEKHGKVIKKLVWVKVGPEQRKIRFTLKPDEKSGRWVVDDLYLNKSDIDAKRSVATRLTVMLGVQDSIDAWRSHSRDQILSAATPEFAEALETLSSQQLVEFSKKVMADLPETVKIMPNERIGEETADLAIEKGGAYLILAMRRQGKRWQLDDLIVKGIRPEDDLGSVRLIAGAMSAAFRFEAAYRGTDRNALRQICTSRFFNGSLADADLSQVKLPQSGPSLDGFTIKLQEKTATFVVPAGDEWMTISLAQQPPERLHAAPRYLVEEVTIYDQQNKRLSALFSSRSTVERFAAALASRNIKALRSLSTYDFVQRVWERATDECLETMPIMEFVKHRPEVIQTQFDGSLTEVTAKHGGITVTYRLRDDSGLIQIDDVIIPATAWPRSFKESAEVFVPVLGFREALRHSDIHLLRSNSSQEFNRIVWSQFDVVPKFDLDVEKFFQAPLTVVRRSDHGARILYGDQSHGVVVEIVRDDGRYVVDEMALVFGPGKGDQLLLKQTIRTRLARGEISTNSEAPRDEGLFTGDTYGARLHD
jgi:hypothetical protein